MKRRWALATALAIVALGVAAAPRIVAAYEQRATPQPYVPAGWPAPTYTFARNPVTAAGFALGRRLFYDPLLSRDRSVSCGSCHQQFAAFAHLDHRVSHGVGGVNGKRNAPALFNLAWQPELMWDGAVHELEVQPLAPLANPVEMGSDLEVTLQRLRDDPRYPALFARAFGSPGIDSQRLLRALTQFTGSLVSDDSLYDRHVREGASFTPQQEAGLALFREHCAACHREPLFSDFSYRNNGLDLGGLDAAPHDAGRATITHRDEDLGRFRVPSLRNVALSEPYMHDGRYETLAQVLDHYASGIADSPTLDPLLVKGIPLTADERAELLAFLDTLTDDRFVHDPRFAPAHD